MVRSNKVLNVSGFRVQIIRKKVRNVRLKVGPDGSVSVSAPYLTPESTITAFVTDKSGWIEKQLERFSSLEREPERMFADGEIHMLFGKAHRLNVVETEGRQRADFGLEGFILKVHGGSSIEDRRRLLNNFYRRELKEAVPEIIRRWEPLMGVRASGFGIRKMKTRWGTCNIHSGKIWINLELAKRRPELLEYLVVHELCHLIERSHNSRFKSLMTGFLPDWRERQKELHSFPLVNTDEHSSE